MDPAFALGGAIGAWQLVAKGPRNGTLWIVGVCVLVAVFGIYCLLSTYRSKVVLFPDRIEAEELTRTDVLSRDEIRGWRPIPTSPGGFVFIPKNPGQRPVKVAQVFRPDSTFLEWVYTLPSLDELDRKRSKGEVRKDARLGATPGERMKSLAKGRRLAACVNIGASSVALWGFLWPQPYETVVLSLVAVPWVALAIVKGSRGLFRVDGYKNDAHPNVAIALIFPGLILMFRGVIDYQVLGALALGWYALGIGVALWFCTCLADATMRTRVGSAIAFFAFAVLYGYGVAAEANALLDRSPEQSYSAEVTDKRVVSGKNYHLPT